MHEYLFKAMVKEANCLEEMADLRSWYLQEVPMAASLCLQQPVSLHKLGSGYLICQLPHALESHKISRSGRS